MHVQMGGKKGQFQQKNDLQKHELRNQRSYLRRYQGGKEIM